MLNIIHSNEFSLYIESFESISIQLPILTIHKPSYFQIKTGVVSK